MAIIRLITHALIRLIKARRMRYRMKQKPEVINFGTRTGLIRLALPNQKFIKMRIACGRCRLSGAHWILLRYYWLGIKILVGLKRALQTHFIVLTLLKALRPGSGAVPRRH